MAHDDPKLVEPPAEALANSRARSTAVGPPAPGASAVVMTSEPESQSGPPTDEAPMAHAAPISVSTFTTTDRRRGVVCDGGNGEVEPTSPTPTRPTTTRRTR